MAQLPRCNKILLVHNTYTSAEDIQWAHRYSKMIYWCLCPKANLYIEGKLPDINYFKNQGARITIGTDSLSSNDTLSVLEEIKTISKHFPEISLEDLVKWSTVNGAEALGLKEFGTIEKGKTPGLNLISNINFKELSLTESSRVKKLL